jgi:hypothetical protein
MVIKLYDLFPEKAENVLAALDDAVLYNRHNSDVNLRGLSVYYIYGGRDTADASLATHADLDIDWEYTTYLRDFASLLMNTYNPRVSRSAGANASVHRQYDAEYLKRTDDAIFYNFDNGHYVIMGIARSDGYVKLDSSLWPSIQGNYISMHQINKTNRAVHYAVPARLNGIDCDVIISFTADSPYGNILGVRNEYGFIIQKGFDEIEKGDRLAFYYQVTDESWILGGEFTVGDNLRVDWVEIDGNLRPGVIFTDMFDNKMYHIDINAWG